MINFDRIANHKNKLENDIDNITVDYTDLNILPLFVNFNSNNKFYTTNCFIKEKIMSKGVNFNYSFLWIGKNYTTLNSFKAMYKINKLKTKSQIKTIFASYISEITSLNQNLFYNIVKHSNNIFYLNKRLFLKESVVYAKNNVNILNFFKNSTSYKSYIRNLENLIIYNNFIYKKTDDGVYPVFMFGVDLNKINEFRYNYLYKAVYNKDYNFSSIKVYIDKDWYLGSCNKVLKIKLLNTITEHFDSNYELILFDGKEFASKNMHGYFEKNYLTLAKRKEYYQRLENKLYNFYNKSYEELDYIKIQNEILEKYNSYIIEQNKKETEVPILENESLNDEDLQSIFNLIGEIDRGVENEH